MHKDPDTNQENDDITCSDYRFVYMGAKGLRVHVMNSTLSFLIAMLIVEFEFRT